MSKHVCDCVLFPGEYRCPVLNESDRIGPVRSIFEAKQLCREPLLPGVCVLPKSHAGEHQRSEAMRVYAQELSERAEYLAQLRAR